MERPHAFLPMVHGTRPAGRSRCAAKQIKTTRNDQCGTPSVLVCQRCMTQMQVRTPTCHTAKGSNMPATSSTSDFLLRARATLGYTVRKKMSPGKVTLCKSCVLRSIYTHTVYNDYYFQIIIEVAQLRQHKQRLNDLRTQLG